MGCKFVVVSVFWGILAMSITHAQTNRKFTLKRGFVEEKLRQSIDRYQVLAKRVPLHMFPRSYDVSTDSLIVTRSNSWTSGFYVGSLWYLFEFSGNKSLFEEAGQRMRYLASEQYNTSTHDVGFMLYCSYGNALRITGDKDYGLVLSQGASSLAQRFSNVVGCVRSWDNVDSSKYLVIIDNMMNLELLNWASRYSDDPWLAKIAISHADKTIENHFREDYSSYHVVDYNPTNGAVRRKHTHQGLADESSWARGQAWGLYGYTMMFRDTKEQRYLDQAVQIAEYISNHPDLPEDKIPLWDFNAVGGPDTERDASAAAITAAALLELSTFLSPDAAEKYQLLGEEIIISLSSPRYYANKGENGGFLIKHATGHMPAGSEVDAPLVYADYYYIEALVRYLKLLGDS